MNSLNFVKTAKIGYIIVSVVMLALGIMFIAVPQFSAAAIGVFVGALLIVFGVVKLVGYFSRDLFRLAFQYDLAFGIFLIVLGTVVLFKAQDILSFLCVVIGIAILADGLFKVQIAIDSKKFGIKNWWLILVLAILAGIVGMVILFYPASSSCLLIVLLGISFAFEGILNLCTAVFAVKVTDSPNKEYIEVEINDDGKD